MECTRSQGERERFPTYSREGMKNSSNSYYSKGLLYKLETSSQDFKILKGFTGIS